MSKEDGKKAGDFRPPDGGRCPILEGQVRMAGLSSDMMRTLRKLRRDVLACRCCACVKDCPVLAQFNAAVQTAVQEVWDEWNMGNRE